MMLKDSPQSNYLEKTRAAPLTIQVKGQPKLLVIGFLSKLRRLFREE